MGDGGLYNGLEYSDQEGEEELLSDKEGIEELLSDREGKEGGSEERDEDDGGAAKVTRGRFELGVKVTRGRFEPVSLSDSCEASKLSSLPSGYNLSKKTSQKKFATDLSKFTSSCRMTSVGRVRRR